MARAGQSSEKAALIYQHSDEERQRDVAFGLDEMVRAQRAKHHKQQSTVPRTTKRSPPEASRVLMVRLWCATRPPV